MEMLSMHMAHDYDSTIREPWRKTQNCSGYSDNAVWGVELNLNPCKWSDEDQGRNRLEAWDEFIISLLFNFYLAWLP